MNIGFESNAEVAGRRLWSLLLRSLPLPTPPPPPPPLNPA